MILFGFISLLIWLINTHQLTLYINSRFARLEEIAGFILLPLCIIQALGIVRPAHAFDSSHNHVSHWRYIPFAIILALAFLLPGNTLNANLVNNKGLDSQPISTFSTSETDRPLAAKLRNETPIEVTDGDYVEIMTEIKAHSQDYLGKEITMTGFVFRPPDAAKNRFSLFRYVIVCCTADTLPYGLLCELNDAGKYQNGTWISIKGTIRTSKYDDRVVPSIKIFSSQQIDEPKNPYVFPPSQ